MAVLQRTQVKVTPVQRHMQAKHLKVIFKNKIIKKNKKLNKIRRKPEK